MSEATAERMAALFQEARASIHCRADRLFANLMVVQWLVGIAVAIWISPRTWMGAQSQTHWHAWAAIFLGGFISALPVLLGWFQPGRVLTRHVIAVAQMLTSALLIHLTGGRIETHFHIFGSLAFLAIYRDYRVLLTATLVVVVDHLARSIFWPQSVFGVLTASPWRWVEHVGWVGFEDTFLFISIRQSLRDMVEVAARCAKLEVVNDDIECQVNERTAELTRENAERHQAEHELRKSEAHLRAVVENLAEGVAVGDLDGRWLHFNRAALAMHGFGSIQECCRPLTEFADRFELSGLDGRVWPVDQWPLSRVLRGEKLCGVEARVRRIGTDWERVFGYGGTLVYDEAGGPLMAVVTINDITERRRDEEERLRMELQLRQAQKLESIGQLAAGIAHEINTPTQYIGDNVRFLQDGFASFSKVLRDQAGLLQAAKEDRVTPDLLAQAEATIASADLDYLVEEIPKAIEQTLNGVTRVTKIVRAMKEFSHPGRAEKTPLDLNHAIESTLTVATNEWKYVAEMATDFDPGLPTVPCLPGEFSQVILNLVVNAAHAIADAVGDGAKGKGLIRVSTRRDGDWAEIRVQDSGTGIPEKVRGRVFEPFFTTKEVGKGTGQGLAIARSVVVDKHRGTLDFETETGKGTTFILRLPLAEPAETKKAA